MQPDPKTQIAKGASKAGLGIGLVLLANLLFSFVDTSTKWLIGMGLTSLQLAFMRYFVHFAIALPDNQRRLRTGQKKLDPKLRGLVVFRSFCLVSATVVNFFALGHLPLAVTAAILFMSPVLICLFAWGVLGERVTMIHWLAVLIGLAGVLLIVQPFGEEVNGYALLMLYPATGMALYTVLTRKLAPDVRPAILQFYTGLLGTLVLLPFGILFWVTPPTPLAWLLTCLIGVFAWAGHEALTRAHAFATASALAPFGYSFVIYLSLAGWIVFDQIPDTNVALGALTIIAAGGLIWFASRRKVTDPKD